MSHSYFLFGVRHGVVFAGFILMLFFCFQARADQSQSVSFAWDPSTDTNVVGYLVDYGTTSGVYTAQMDVGSNTTATLTNLTEGDTYYIVIVAYDSQARQSDPSGEISVAMPGMIYLTAGQNPGDPMQVTFPTAPGHWYELQSGSPGSWQTIWQTDVATDFETVEYDDPIDPSVPTRFYRLILH